MDASKLHELATVVRECAKILDLARDTRVDSGSAIDSASRQKTAEEVAINKKYSELFGRLHADQEAAIVAEKEAATAYSKASAVFNDYVLKG